MSKHTSSAGALEYDNEDDDDFHRKEGKVSTRAKPTQPARVHQGWQRIDHCLWV